jgi:preprotein translocase SecE subunit
MATAVQSTPIQPQPPATSRDGSLLPGSLIGAVIFFAGVAAAGYISTSLPETLAYQEAYRLFAFGLVTAIGVFVAGRIAGLNPVRGLRGGIVLAISALIATAFIVRAFAVNLDGTSFGMPVTIVVLIACLFALFRLLTSETGRGWANAIEDQGWTHTDSYKRSQGVKVRRYTLIGILLIGATGAWAVYQHRAAGTGDAVLAVPFTDLKLPLLPIREIVVPMLLGLASLWIAWRAVNMPTFADFLIATEAEMNKVSWTSRKKLVQDTIVVLVTVALLTVFLLVIDLFWGWALSRSFIGVLPSRDAAKQQITTPDGGKKLDW